jgi:hypothetical protein
MKYTLDDMYNFQNKYWSLEYQDFYRKTFEETLKPYPHNPQRVVMLQNRARAILYKSPHYSFLKNHLFDFSAINAYGDEHFGWMDDETTDNPPLRLVYFYCFIAVCIEEGYGDDKYEFENDLLSIIDLIDDLREVQFSEDTAKYLRRELKPWLTAYRIICDAKYKLSTAIDTEFWYCEPDKRDPKNEWYSYYLPVNLDLAGGSDWPLWEVLMSAREKIFSTSKVLNMKDV